MNVSYNYYSKKNGRQALCRAPVLQLWVQSTLLSSRLSMFFALLFRVSLTDSSKLVC
jgi:hypothetical protein